MNSIRRGLLLVISFCMLFTQSMWVTAAPMKMSLSTVQIEAESMDCHQSTKPQMNQHDCCQQDNVQHQCGGDCEQCFTAGMGANITFSPEIFGYRNSQQNHHSSLDFFYQFKPDNGLRPPIA